ncbi:MAG TPA: ATP-binding cassette domain-containing protein, partial [Labilithrix sp.]|nr:ATP-binding cassette domain-containing protein [Labilithrix sp.]
LRRHLAYVPQHSYLFGTSIRANIALSDPSLPLARVMEAARLAEIHDDISAMPMGYDSILADGGASLSGGQKQRIALARALVREPKVLVLDDPLSAVDAKTESAILDAIERQAESRTVILITHRVAAASRCDDILVLDEGRVLEHGTHAELVEAGGLYAKFAAEQSAKSELEAVEVDEPLPPPVVA